ncbi:lipoprotein, putative [Pseudomonas orientalis]|uniref:hypothetical protein n=1 Tax=Pseudomonas orientalis TaxID=76758 RepID=UPI000F560A40|nr:hypothetical protein [Pseudomonas orientalis]AZE94008.1 lipoprotein, putative [Pseudomonas orientalis]AZE99406.1 lipoprotein, putative [Pseudomonas orientalis]
MRRWMESVLLAAGVAWLTGCAANSFTLEVDLPAGFELKTAANYRPAMGETCTLPQRRGKRPERKLFFTDYKPSASRVSYELPLSEKVEGCPLVLANVEFDFTAKWGTRNTDIGGDSARIFIRDRLDTPGMPKSGVQQILGRCQWWFRTLGPVHSIRKILQCRSVDASGQQRNAKPVGVAQRDQLQGKTLRMVLTVSAEEQPAFGNNWVAVPGGWKRCRGKSFEDMYGHCNGDKTNFKPVKMPDGRICDVYPSCN